MDKMKKLIFLLAFSLPALGQLNSVYNASTYAYTTQVTQGNSTTGSSSVRANPTAFAQGIPFLPYNLNAPITINRNAANAETLTPSGVSNCFSNSLTCTLSGTFTYKHISGESIQSGTFGLQEALNIAITAGSGTVLIDATWQGSGTSQITGAAGSTTVMIQDNRNPSGAVFYQWDGTHYVATGGSSTVNSVFGRNGNVTAQTGDYTCAQVIGCTSKITSINGDTTAAQTFNAAGTGLSVNTIAGVTTYTLAGAAGSGSVVTAPAFAIGQYLSAGTAISGAPGLYATVPSMTLTQLNTLFGAVANGTSVLITNGTTQGPGVVNTNLGAYSVRFGDNYAQSAIFGIACDGAGFFLTFTSGSNQVFVGSDLSAADIGKTFFVATRTGYTYGSTQESFEPTITAYNSGTQIATISANAPFNFTGWVSVGTDNTANLQTALNALGYGHPLSIPTGCMMLTNTLAWNNSQSIIGQSMFNSGFIGAPGRDILQQPDTSGQGGASGPGVRVENLQLNLNTNIDASLGFTDYGSNGTPTTVAPVYRPLMTASQPANNPLAPGWITAGKNGVASVTAVSSVICVPTTLGYVPTVGQTIIFPYFPTIVKTTVVSNTGAGCSAGFSASTLANAMPSGDTAAQAEWFTGSAVQSTTTTIPTTITYPLTLLLTLPINPIPGFETNFSDHGVVKVCGIEAEYMGVNGYSSPYQIVLRNGPTSSAGCTGTTPVVPVNPCYAANRLGPGGVDQPYPVIPTINSGDSTPSGATVFPGWCGGNAAISFPSLNGDTYVQTGLTKSFVTNINTQPAQGMPANENSGIGVYLAGNNTGYQMTWDGFASTGLPYGFVEGPASAGQHGVAAVGPTSTGSNWHNCSIHAWFPIILVNAQQGKIDRCDTYTELYSPYDGSIIGPGTALFLGYTTDEQNGNVVTNTAQISVEDWNGEPETNGGNFQITPAYAVLDCTYCNYKQASFEGAFTIWGSSNQTVYATSQISVPAINYGTNNHFENIGGLNVGYVLNAWSAGGNNNQFYNWGQLSSLSCQNGTNGTLGDCGVGYAQTYNGRTMEAGVGADLLTPWENTLGGQILPGEMQGMTNSFTVDTSGSPEPSWGAYATCAITTGSDCPVAHFNSGFLYIGQHNRLAPRGYQMAANLRMVSGSNNVQVIISAFDSGSGTCANPAANIAAGTFTVGTSWTPIYLPVSFATRAGCVAQLQFGPGSATDWVQVGAVDFIPQPLALFGPATAPTEGAACTPSGTWLGVFSGFSYFCDGGTVKRVAVS